MQVKSMLATLGLGVAAGAATVLLMPKHSEAYRAADHAAHAMKDEAVKMIDTMRKS